MKRTAFLLLGIAIFLVFSLMIGAETAEELPDYNADEISIFVDGTQLDCSMKPFIDNGRTLVPMRAIFERLEAVVEWEGTTQTITATKGDTAIVMQIGNTELLKNGAKETMDVAPVIVGGSTFVPLRAVSQALGTTVDWFGNMRTASITSKGKTPVELFVIFDKEGHVKKATREQALSLQIDGWFVSEFQQETLWNGGECVTVYDYEALQLLSNGWTKTEPTVKMYAKDGRTIDVPASRVAANEAVGWHTEPFVAMYAPDGRVEYFLQSKVAAQESVGWSRQEPTFLMYNKEGSVLVRASEVAAYKAAGWYTEPLVAMYASDGRIEYFEQSKVEAQMTVGWSKELFTTYVYDYDGNGYKVYMHEKKEYLADGFLESKPNDNYGSSSGYNPSADGYYYRTPSGKKYHLDPNCGGKNSYRTNSTAGLSPCSKCAY